MHIYQDPTFDMAAEQFRIIADFLDLDSDARARLLYPKRSLCVTLPILMDDGRTEVFQGYRCQHHLTLGPTKGGVRFHPSVTLGEVAALSIWMSWKCALTGLPYGGAKGGIAVDPRALSSRELESLSRRYMNEMSFFVGPQTDIIGPDMGTNEQVMAWFMDTYSVHAGHAVPEIVTGKPVSIGGTSGRREATGRGVAYLVERALDVLKMEPNGRTVVIQGYGNVGAVAAQSLALKGGMKVIAISDAYGAWHNPSGIDILLADSHVAKNGDLRGFSGAESIDPAEMLELPCDVLIPAAVEGVIHGNNAARLRCRILAEGANGPTTPAADLILAERGGDLYIIPDILCNSGGVIVSYFEWVQGLQRLFWNETEVMDKLYRILETAFTQVNKRARDQNISHRMAAMAIGVERVARAKMDRGLFP